MNLRDIKKDIEYVIGAFVDECSMVMLLNQKVDGDKVTGLFDEAVNLYNDLRDRVCAKVEGGKKAWFHEIRKDLVEGVNALYVKLSDLVTEAAK